MSGALSRLTLLHINLIGAGTALVLALILFFAVVKPKAEQVDTVKVAADAQEKAGGTDQGVKGKQTELNKTQQEAAKTAADWEVNNRYYMPTLDLNGDLLEVYQNKLIRIPTEVGRFVANWYDGQRNLGVARLPGVDFPVEPFPTDPNYISTIQYLKFPQGNPWVVNIEAKDFNAAMAHLRRFNSMQHHGMPVINDVTLAGQSPNLTLSYELALYVIPSKPMPSEDPIIKGGAAAAGGMRGGMPGGMMGGSSMMMGGGGSSMMGGRSMPSAAPAGGRAGGGGKAGSAGAD